MLPYIHEDVNFLTTSFEKYFSFSSFPKSENFETCWNLKNDIYKFFNSKFGDSESK